MWPLAGPEDYGGVLALEDPSGINAALAIGRGNVRSVADQAAGGNELALKVDRWDSVARCQRLDLVDPGEEERIVAHQECPGRSSREDIEGPIDLAFATGLQDEQLYPPGEQIVAALDPAVINGQILSIDVAGFAQPWRNPAILDTITLGDETPRKPIAGIGRCA